MKKILAGILAMTMAASLAACGGSSAPSSSAAPASSAAPSSSAEASAPAESSSSEASDSTPNIDRIKSAGKLVMMTNASFPPFEYIGDDGKPAGVDVDVAQAIADDLGVELEILDMNFDLLIDSLKTD